MALLRKALLVARRGAAWRAVRCGAVVCRLTALCACGMGLESLILHSPAPAGLPSSQLGSGPGESVSPLPYPGNKPPTTRTTRHTPAALSCARGGFKVNEVSPLLRRARGPPRGKWRVRVLRRML